MLNNKSWSTHAQETLIYILRGVAVISLSAVVTILAARMVGGPALSINQTSTQKDSTFDVTGSTSLAVIPDKADIRLGIQVTRPSVEMAQEEINTIINEVSQQLKNLGIDKKDIQTSNYSLNPNYDYRSESGREINGYNANATLKVSIRDFEVLNQAIDRATAAGANQVGGVNFGLSDEKQDEIETQARKEAIEDAQEKAKELARLSGMKLDRIVNVQVMDQPKVDLYRSYEMPLATNAEDMAEPTQLEPGSTNFEYTVVLSYETL